MPAVIIGGEKGGTAKSTTATNLSVMLALEGKKVLLLDCDRQLSSHKFAEHREELKIYPGIPCAIARGKHVSKEIEALSENYEYVIIDAGGQDSIELRSALTAPSVIKLISPFQPTSFDLETLDKMNEIVDNAQIYNTRLKAYSLLTRASTNPMKVDNVVDAVQALKQLDTIEFSNIILFERVAYQDSIADAFSVVEYERKKINSMSKSKSQTYISKSSIEICDLFFSVFGYKFNYEKIFGTPLKSDNEVSWIWENLTI